MKASSPSWSRHARVATRCRQDGHALGLELFAREERFAAPTVPAFKVPERIGWFKLNHRFCQCGLVGSDNYGRLVGCNFRPGYMGIQADDLFDQALEDIAAAVGSATR